MISKLPMKAVAAAALTLTLATGAHANNIVADGSFVEGASVGGYQGYAGGSDLGAWKVTGDSVDLIGGYWQKTPTGSFTIDLAGTNAGGLSQGLHLDAGDYQVSFWLAGNPDGGSATKTVDVSVAGVSQSFSFLTTGHNESNMGFTLETLSFSLATGMDTTLSFSNAEADTPWGAAIGGVSLVAVPEPGSMALLLAGLGLFGVMAKRRVR